MHAGIKNYPATIEGVCHGVAHMGMQAILSEDTRTFDRRFELINDIPLTHFTEKIAFIKQQQLTLIQKIKEEMGHFKKLSSEKQQHLENQKIVNDKLRALEDVIHELVKEGKLKEEDKQAELERRKEMLLFNAFVQEKINKRMFELPEDERIKLSIPIFFEDLALYQEPFTFPQLARPKKPDAMLTVPLVISEQLELQGGISRLKESFSGVGSANELTAYFDDLSEVLNKLNPPLKYPIALVLQSSNHTFTVGYDSIKKEWLFIDANQLPTQHITQAQELATNIVSGFSLNNIVAFNTEIYVNKSDEERLNQCITEWKSTKSWQRLHTVAKNKNAYLVDSYNSSWLYIASRYGHIDVVKALLATNADPNQIVANSNTPLYIAVANGYTDIVHELLAADANPNQANKDGTTPLFMAAQDGYGAIVEALLAAHANPNQANKDGTTPLFMAAQNGYRAIVEVLLAAHANPNYADTDGITPLYIAAQNGYGAIVEALLATHANPNYAATNGTTPLYIASQNGHIEVVNKLLKANADPDRADTDGTSPLYIASENGHIEVVKKLLKANANPNQADKNDFTPLYIASQNGHIEIVKKLSKANANPNCATKNNATPLFIAAQQGHADIVNTLLLANANPNQATKNNATPLFIAAQNGHIDIVKLLLSNDANITTKFESSVASLRDFAKENHVEKHMEDLIAKKSVARKSSPFLSMTAALKTSVTAFFGLAKEKNVEKRTEDLNIKKNVGKNSSTLFSSNIISNEISITAEEIAIVMGHTEIADLLGQKMQKNLSNKGHS